MKTQIKIHPIPSLQDNYIWAIIDLHQQTVCIVDPGDATPVEEFVTNAQLTLNAILITHHHGDHTFGAHELKNRYQVPVYGPLNSPFSGITMPLENNAHVPENLCSLNLTTLTIPGHTLDHMAFYAPGFLFCGDTLFSGGCGRLFEGSALQLHHSLQQLAALPPNTGIYCGHEYTLNNLRFAKQIEPSNSAISDRLERAKQLRQKNLPTLPSTLREEQLTNPFLRCDSPEIIASVEAFSGQELTTDLQVFTWLRRWKDEFK